MIEFNVGKGRDLTTQPDTEAGEPELMQKIPAPPSPLSTVGAKKAAAEDDAKRQAAALQSNPMLVALERRFLENRYLHRPMTDKGKKKATFHIEEETFLVHSVVWNESREQCLADCVKLDSVLNIPETSKTYP
jgi:hypothetical protein